MKIKLCFFATIIFLSSCATEPEIAQKPLVDINGKRCVGTIMSVPTGLVEVQDEELLKSALGTAGKGLLCAGKVFAVEKPVTVYRVWDGSKAITAYGRWWSLNLPSGPRDEYQKTNGMCPSWSALDRVSHCTLKVGAHVVIGPGQSVSCEDGLYPASPQNQIFVPNGGKDGTLLVEHCTAGVTWP